MRLFGTIIRFFQPLFQRGLILIALMNNFGSKNRWKLVLTFPLGVSVTKRWPRSWMWMLHTLFGCRVSNPDFGLIQMSIVPFWPSRHLGNALDQAGLQPEDLDLIIVSSTSPDFIFPSTACLVQARLGLQGLPAFDCFGILLWISLWIVYGGWIYSEWAISPVFGGCLGKSSPGHWTEPT